MKTILVTGANGQLAKCIKDLESEFPGFKFIYTNSSEFDITKKDQTAFFNTYEIDWCINSAAYTAVDLAERESDKATEVNTLGCKNIAQACKDFNINLVHISTDFVFDGNTSQAYRETDTTNPIGIYGLTKLNGENEIISVLENHYIIRTSWLYSEYGNNFLKTMLRLAKDRKEINVVENQIGTPTYAKDLAKMLLIIIEKENKNFGIYHYSNEGVASWYDFAKAIFEINNSSIKINPIPSENYPTPAKRPSFSVLDKSKIKNTFQIEIPYWRDSLKTAMSRI